MSKPILDIDVSKKELIVALLIADFSIHKKKFVLKMTISYFL